MNDFTISCLSTIMTNRSELPRYHPERAFEETDDTIRIIILQVQENRLDNEHRHELYYFNSYLQSKLGKMLKSHDNILSH